MPREIVRDGQGRDVVWVSNNGRVWAMGEERRLLCGAVEESDEIAGNVSSR